MLLGVQLLEAELQSAHSAAEQAAARAQAAQQQAAGSFAEAAARDAGEAAALGRGLSLQCCPCGYPSMYKELGLKRSSGCRGQPPDVHSGLLSRSHTAGTSLYRTEVQHEHRPGTASARIEQGWADLANWIHSLLTELLRMLS